MLSFQSFHNKIGGLTQLFPAQNREVWWRKRWIYISIHTCGGVSFLAIASLWTLQIDIQCWLESPKLLPGTVELFPLYFSFWEGYNFSKWSSLLPGWFCSSLISCGLENGYNIFIYYRSPIPLSPIPIPSLSHPHETFSFQEPSKNFYIQLWDFLWKKREKKKEVTQSWNITHK